MKNIEIGTAYSLFNIKNGKDITHRITNISVNVVDNSVGITIEKGNQTERINLSLQEASSIGFINFDSLKQFCR